jgi:uncharacterized protein
MDYLSLLFLLGAGVFGGILSGLLGVGGGLVFIPIIQYIIQDKVAPGDIVSYTIGNSLMIIFIVGLSGFLKQRQLKNTDTKATIYTGIAAVCSSLLVTALLNIFEINDLSIFKSFFTLVLIVTIIRVLIGQFSKNKDSEVLNLPPYKKFIPAGLFAGIITSLTGLGGGVIMVPYFNKILKLPVRFSTGLSLSVIPIIALPLIIYYMVQKPVLLVFPTFQTGFMMWAAIIPLGLSAAISARWGIILAQKMRPSIILFLFLAFSLFTLFRVLFFK